MKVFVIVVIYNGLNKDWISKCFTSVEKSSIETKIIAIDNCSTDKSVEYIKNNFQKVLLIESKQNIGFGRANNLGLKKALELNGEYFFLLNQDAYVESDTIEKLVFHSKTNPNFGIISPLHLNGSGSALDFNFSNYISPYNCPNLYSDFVLGKVKDKVYSSNFICAAAWLLTKECLRTVGGFNPSFFHYGEDDNYVHRMKYKKIDIGVYPLSKIYHDRENRRSNSIHQNKDRLIERALLIQFSNPLIDRNNLFRTNVVLIIKSMIYIILLKWNSSKRLIREIRIQSKIKKMSLINYQRSMSNEEYIFIND